MKTELQQIFDSVPPDEPRSRLEPYRELILRWRRQGRTYRRIQGLLAECSVTVSAAMVHKFVQSRSRVRETQPESRAERVVITEYPPALPAPEPESSQTAAPVGLRRRRSREELAAQRDAIRSAYNKPVVSNEEPEEVFVYDPDKPPINKNY